MTSKNKYACRSRISEDKIRQIVRLFADDSDASQIAAAVGLNRNTINRCLTAFRERIVRCREAEPAGEHAHAWECERFRTFAKTRLARFRGLHKQMSHLHLKECEFRFIHRQEDMYKLVLKMLRDFPLNQARPDTNSRR